MENIKSVISRYLVDFSSLETVERILKDNKAEGFRYPETDYYANFLETIGGAKSEIERLKKDHSKGIKVAYIEWIALLERVSKRLDILVKEVKRKIHSIIEELNNHSNGGEEMMRLVHEKEILESPILRVLESFRDSIEEVLRSVRVPIKGLKIVLADGNQKKLMSFCEDLSDFFNNKPGEIKTFFSGEGIQRKLDWNIDQKSLRYFVIGLCERELLSEKDSNKRWARSEECFTNNGDAIKSRSIGTNNEEPNEKIKEMIDKMLNMLLKRPN